jgi:thiol-disulfide isomerase/thioredoxin
MKRLLPLTAVMLLAAGCNRPAPDQATTPEPAKATASAAPVAATVAKPAAPSVASNSPSLKVTTVTGGAYDLAAHRGKWVVVNFWATWCGPCLKEMPELSALDAMRENIDVIGLAYEDIKPEEMSAFLKVHPVVYPVAIVDVYAPPADFASPRGLPMSYLIAPDGTVAKQFLGPVTAKDIEAAIAAAGGPKPV